MYAITAKMLPAWEPRCYWLVALLHLIGACYADSETLLGDWNQDPNGAPPPPPPISPMEPPPPLSPVEPPSSTMELPSHFPLESPLPPPPPQWSPLPPQWSCPPLQMPPFPTFHKSPPPLPPNSVESSTPSHTPPSPLSTASLTPPPTSYFVAPLSTLVFGCVISINTVLWWNQQICWLFHHAFRLSISVDSSPPPLPPPPPPPPPPHRNAHLGPSSWLFLAVLLVLTLRWANNHSFLLAMSLRLYPVIFTFANVARGHRAQALPWQQGDAPEVVLLQCGGC